jgi:hypothetical protein
MCNVTLQTPVFGGATTFVTYAIASNAKKAVEIAKEAAEKSFPKGWTVTNTFAKREMLEQVAEEVLGWRKPVQ